MIDLDTIRLGTDLRAPVGGSITVTASGDVDVVSGRESLAVAMQRRMATEPGALVHRPTYGCGLLSRIGTANSPAGRVDLATRIRRNLLQDARLKDVSVTLAAGSTAGTVDVSVTITLRDDTRSALTFTVSR